jgi:hypothetical protein
MPNPGNVKTVRCLAPGCDKQKGTVNHWYVVWMSMSHQHEKMVQIFCCQQFDPLTPLHTGQFPVCGQECAAKMFSKYLASGTLP